MSQISCYCKTPEQCSLQSMCLRFNLPLSQVNTTEQVHHPKHYGGADNPYEVIKVMEAWLTREQFIGAMLFNIYKYMARAKQKGGEQDYAKAAWYNNHLQDYLTRNPA